MASVCFLSGASSRLKSVQAFGAFFFSKILGLIFANYDLILTKYGIIYLNSLIYYFDYLDGFQTNSHSSLTLDIGEGTADTICGLFHYTQLKC